MKSNVGEEIASLLASCGGSLSVYIHIPFCAEKCPYCSFFSTVPRREEIEEYCRLLCMEIRYFGERLFKEERSAAIPMIRGVFGSGRPETLHRTKRSFCSPTSVETIYFGGGTPTLLSPKEWELIFDSIYKYLPVSKKAEISVEANPDSLSEEHLDVWGKRSVSRISVGVQSLSNDELRWLGRLHDAEAARRSLRESAGSGFSVSADLMFGLRGQTLRSFKYSIDETIDLGVDHLSVYQLVIDEKSRWFTSPPEGRSDGYPFYRWSQWYLPRKGFLQYEIASFAWPGKECRHNTSYWTNGPVLALGAGAWGYVKGVRYRNEQTLSKYTNAIKHFGNAVAEAENPDKKERAREAAILLLRTAHGISFKEFALLHGEDELHSIIQILKENVPSNCLFWSSASVALSPKGMRIANSIWSLIV